MGAKHRCQVYRGLGMLFLAAMVAGCGIDEGGGTALGSLSVSITDAPACGFDEVNVTVEKVRVHRSGSADPNSAGWVTIALNPPRKINLLDLNDPLALEQLGVTPLEAGSYTQVRLVLVRNVGGPPFANSVVLSGTATEIELDTPSAVQSGIKLIHAFTVSQGQRVDLLLDFDACKSIVRTGSGKFKLKPVIKIIPFELNGIQGFLDPTLFPGQTNANNVIVTAQMGGNVIQSTMPNVTTGEFMLARLAPGNYDVVITANNSPTNDCCATALITGVPVLTSSSITTISNQASPFQLQPSGFHTIGDTVTLINPPAVDDRDDAAVNVVARQTLVGGPIVTVSSQVATVNDGAMPVGDYQYGLLLPIASPSLASYGTGTLPITPTSVGQGPAAGVYTVQGSAQTPTTSYVTQAPAPLSVNISAGDKLDQDFTLAP